MIRDELEKLLEEVLEDGDINIGDEERAEEIVKDFFESKEIPHTCSCDDMFDSSGFDVWSFAISWIENMKPELLIYRMTSS